MVFGWLKPSQKSKSPYGSGKGNIFTGALQAVGQRKAPTPESARGIFQPAALSPPEMFSGRGLTGAQPLFQSGSSNLYGARPQPTALFGRDIRPGTRKAGLFSQRESPSTRGYQWVYQDGKRRYVPISSGNGAGDGAGGPGYEEMPTGVNLPGNLQRWESFIHEASKRHGVPPAVIAAIMQLESNGKPGALSPSGAIGLMQIMPFHGDKATKYGRGGLSDPYTNVMVGAEILKWNFDFAKKSYDGVSDRRAWEIAAAAYLGDWNWKSGNFAGHADAHGTTGSKYLEVYNKWLEEFGVYDGASMSGIGPDGLVNVWDVFGGGRHTITQHYGNRPTDPFLQQAYASTGGIHTGLDIGVASGTPLYTPFEGTVVTAGTMGGYGTAVYLKTSFGYLLLGHMSSTRVKPGQKLKAGSLVGYSGNTGASTGAHLHIEVRDHNGKWFDTRKIFKY